MVLCQYLVDKRQVDVAAHVLGKPIVLFFFECMVIESAGIPGQFVCKRRKQEIYELRIVENAMNIGPHAGGVHAVTVGRAVLQKIQGRIGSTFHGGGHSHMDFITLH